MTLEGKETILPDSQAADPTLQEETAQEQAASAASVLAAPSRVREKGSCAQTS